MYRPYSQHRIAWEQTPALNAVLQCSSLYLEVHVLARMISSLL